MKLIRFCVRFLNSLENYRVNGFNNSDNSCLDNNKIRSIDWPGRPGYTRLQIAFVSNLVPPLSN